MKASRY